ncbi:MAG: hypothetical protein E6G92_07200 [Alphaproteobacteria bacterium]|nr:MAG: hypothetical protein E6G92_07200 [Alphaproteobacteria bacterium]
MIEPEHLASAAPAVRAEVLRLLDEISRPLGVREVEHRLRDCGVSRSQRIILARALAGLTVIAIVKEN